jgi:hypothetical protein
MHVFFARVEQSLLQGGPKPLGYVRYHDDILSIHCSQSSMYTFYAELKRLAQPVFKVVVEQVAHTGNTVDFLDMSISFSGDSLTIEATQCKPITPLCPSSAHHKNVHQSWPSSVCSRVYNISDSKQAAMLKLCNRYKHANTHPETLKRFESWSPSPRKAMVNSGSDPTRKPFVLRYHPLLPRVLQRALTSTPIPVECGLRIMPAWQNALPSLGSIIAKCNRDKVKRREGWREGFLCVSNTPDRSLRSVYGLTSLCTQ